MQVAYTQRRWADSTEIDAFLTSQQVGVLSLTAEDYPYAVPVNYLWHNHAIYFHGLGSGRKFDLLAQSPKAGFTVFSHHGTTTDPMPCHADTSYTSVMIFGTACMVIDPEERTAALQALVSALMPGFYRNDLTTRLTTSYRSGIDANPVAVYRLTPDELTGKQNLADAGDLFTPTV